jgi:hypothetical protein
MNFWALQPLTRARTRSWGIHNYDVTRPYPGASPCLDATRRPAHQLQPAVSASGCGLMPAFLSLLLLAGHNPKRDAKHKQTASSMAVVSTHADHSGNFQPCGNTFCQTGTAGLGIQVGEDGQDAAVVVVGWGQAEFGEDACAVLGHCLLGDEQALGDRAVGTALGHEREYLAFPWG